MIKPVLSGLLAALLLIGGGAIAKAVEDKGHDYPEARSYAVSEDAEADVDAALARAAENGKRVMLVMGANWCHDSRALAGWLGTPRFAKLIEREYELVFINVGMPQEGDGHNQDILFRFGFEPQVGTPLVMALSPDGEVLNRDTAQSWRNTASRSEEDIIAELTHLAEKAS